MRLVFREEQQPWRVQDTYWEPKPGRMAGRTGGGVLSTYNTVAATLIHIQILCMWTQVTLLCRNIVTWARKSQAADSGHAGSLLGTRLTTKNKFGHQVRFCIFSIALCCPIPSVWMCYLRISSLVFTVCCYQAKSRYLADTDFDMLMFPHYGIWSTNAFSRQ